MKSSQFGTVTVCDWLHKKGGKSTSQVDEFLVSTRPFISHVIFHC